MLNQIGQNTLQRSSSQTLQYRTESRDFNIITCQNLGKGYESMTRLPKLGTTKDFPATRNNHDSNQLIDRNIIAPRQQNQEAINSNINNKSTQQLNRIFIQQPNLINSSSLDYDFLSYTKVDTQKDIQFLQKTIPEVTNQQKSIAMYTDLGRLFAPNFNPEFQDTFKTNENAFRRGQGMCADTYDRAHTYGPSIKPFRKFQ